MSVQVVEFKSRVFYVMGQVVVPGIKPYTGTDTIVKVIADAKLNELGLAAEGRDRPPERRRERSSSASRSISSRCTPTARPPRIS